MIKPSMVKRLAGVEKATNQGHVLLICIKSFLNISELAILPCQSLCAVVLFNNKLTRKELL